MITKENLPSLQIWMLSCITNTIGDKQSYFSIVAFTKWKNKLFVIFQVQLQVKNTSSEIWFCYCNVKSFQDIWVFD